MDEHKLPPLTKMAFNLVGSFLQLSWHFAQTGETIVSKEVVEKRIAVCESNQCGQFRKSDKRCAACGCYLELKAHLTAMHCPEYRWPGDAEKAFAGED